MAVAAKSLLGDLGESMSRSITSFARRATIAAPRCWPVTVAGTRRPRPAAHRRRGEIAARLITVG
ncbi:hypothetical protein [Nocardia amikacinitolerans]|uniref:hypothetical protein n=1 Tax=Nocardia amikacinitolerans TaxID=756689 RepID=UPI001C3F8707|nr:hypothetical protein [Nocardia amikacinitolerans]